MGEAATFPDIGGAVKEAERHFNFRLRRRAGQKAVDDCRAVIEMSGLPPISINAKPTLTHP